jgi:hypothetical protein
MKKKNYQTINFASGKNRKGKSPINQKGMPIIRCICGKRILVVPDLRAMNRAIQNHVDEHSQANYGVVPDSLKAFLTEQILFVAGEINLPNVS